LHGVPRRVHAQGEGADGMTHQRSLLIEEPPLQVLPKLAAVIGLNEAIVLQQIHYWLGRSSNVRDDRKWVYKTAQEWVDEFPFWSEATVKRAVASLKERGLIVVGKESRTSWNRTNWYSVNYEALSRIGAICTDAWGQVAPMHGVKLTSSIGSKCAVRTDQIDPITSTEITSKTTTEKPPHRRPGEDYTPTPEAIAWVRKKGFEPWLELHVEQFRDSCKTQERKPYAVDGLDAAFRNCVRCDWGGVRAKAQRDARIFGAGAPLASRAKVFCRYCPRESSGTVGGIPYCSEHSGEAMDRKPAPVPELRA